MLWLSVLTVACVMSVGRVNADYNGCHNSSWVYFSHTHSCIGRGERKLNWTQARDDCKQYKGGLDGKTQGHLVKIEDARTNNFVKDLWKNGRSSFRIGLHWNPSQVKYRWDGFPNEEATFFSNSLLKDTREDGQAQYLIIKKDGWYHKLNTQTLQSFCESEARIPRTKMTCPPTPVNINEESSVSSSPVECQFYFNQWNSARITSVPNSQVPVVSCTKGKTGSACETDMSQQNRQRTTLRFGGPFTVRHTGSWTCSIYNTGNKLLDTKTCDLKAYKAPTSTKCSIELHPYVLNASCSTSIYPNALCEFSYQNGDESWTEIEVTQKSDKLHGKNQANVEMFYVSTCSFSLSLEDLKLKPGKVVIKVKIHPAMKDLDERASPKAFYKRHQDFVIELPKAEFIINHDKEITSDSTISLSYYADSVNLTCHMKSGNPQVQSTTVACDFPINEIGDNSETRQGSVVRLTLQVNNTMHGKTCVCWGKHMGRRTRSRTLTLTWSSHSASDENIGLIIGLVVAFVLLLVIAVIVLFFFLRRRKNETPQTSTVQIVLNCFCTLSCFGACKRKGARENPGFCSDEVIYSNGAKVVRRQSDEDRLQGQPDEYAYSNTEPQPSTQAGETDASHKGLGDKHSKPKGSKEGLVYMDIVIDGVSARPVLKGDNAIADQKRAFDSNKKDPMKESVEYTTISVAATMKMKTAQRSNEKD